MSAGTYQLRVGALYYVGSSGDLRKRKMDHAWRLRAGVHRCKRMQSEYDSGKEIDFLVTGYLSRMKGEDEKAFRDRLRDAEQVCLDAAWGDEGLENLSPDSRGPNNGEMMKSKWSDTETREVMLAMVRKSAKNRVLSESARAAMSRAKMGANNVTSRAVRVFCPGGEVKDFGSGRAAAVFFGVSQQVLHLWMTGRVSWPGTGVRTKAGNEWIASYRAEFVET